MLQSCWLSSDHCRHRAEEEIGKALRSPPLWLREHHLEAATRWYARAGALGGRGLWDRVAEGGTVTDPYQIEAAAGSIRAPHHR